MSHDITTTIESEPRDDSEDVRSWAGDFDPLADQDERRVLFAALDSFRQYRRTAHMNTTHRRRQAFYALPSAHWQMLAEPPFSILENFNRVDDAIDVNAEIADAILATGLSSFGLAPDPHPADPRGNWHGTATTSDVNKAHSTLRQFYRDWSAEGRAERELCYDPVIQDLRTEFGVRVAAGQEIRVLVPGAGLGRLVFDLARAGFSPEGNEISYHQLLASSWVLNHTLGTQKHSLYPFALHFSNLLSREQQLQTVRIPDQHPGTVMAESQGNPEAPRFGQMSMSAADFVVLYRQPDNREAFDAVATVFFIDTAPNLIRYIETIHHCLKANGLWINTGPLLWHFEDGANRSHENSHDPQDQGISEPGNVELTEAEVFCLVERMGFVIEQRQPAHERPLCGYIQDPNSMLLPLYRPSHWVARKKSD
ncbi:N2227-domain-containing protein [Aspergillus saccharolyticus JOP 1030-1]|uniref:carnosine N-methyltransferase n=1 Tax=Aspergillus saccharolyticus JOP 1030-1 TaxID=1450539 RepID=A0A318ZE69_9EURO|nr:N2227-domain-containing protein [Aspergillus saccharolyticus JOP 1030-1]PYH45679.1 N2227-domain-containing protein [Aspergillus saccharolyticus JOP 1030-1]